MSETPEYDCMFHDEGIPDAPCNCDTGEATTGSHPIVTPPVQPKYTVSGNHLRVTRLDADGQPIGEPIEVDGPVSFTLDACDVIDAVIDGDTVTLEVDPNQTRLDSLFMGRP